MSARVVILTASSGGGHNAAANALKTLIEHRLGEACEFSVIDVYKKNLFQRLPMLARLRYHCDFLWFSFLNLTNFKVITHCTAGLMRPFMVRSIKKQLPEQCDYLIAVHFNPAHCLPQLAARFPKPPKTIIMATDFDPHWAWFGCGADAMYVMSDSGKEKALKCGYQSHQIYTLPLIPTGHTEYRSPSIKASPSIQLGLVSGQDGSNPNQILGLLKVLASMPNAADISISVFCGTNIQLLQQVRNLMNDCHPLQLNAQGYTANLKSQFHQFDLMLIRTSPGILSECVSAGVPVVGFDWSAHEHYQQHFIQMHGIGFASRKLKDLQGYLSGLFANPQMLEHLQKNVAWLRKQNDSEAMLTHLLNVEVR